MRKFQRTPSSSKFTADYRMSGTLSLEILVDGTPITLDLPISSLVNPTFMASTKQYQKDLQDALSILKKQALDDVDFTIEGTLNLVQENAPNDSLSLLKEMLK